jgi:hypothetical protein
MLDSTFVFRRFDQNPSSIVTARTGTLCSFAYGDFVRFSTPCSCHPGDPALAVSSNPHERVAAISGRAAAVAPASERNVLLETLPRAIAISLALNLSPQSVACDAILAVPF